MGARAHDREGRAAADTELTELNPMAPGTFIEGDSVRPGRRCRRREDGVQPDGVCRRFPSTPMSRSGG